MTMGRDGWTKAHTFLGALRSDVRGNTMAMMAIAVIPLAGMVGGGIDLSRMYIVKTRLQHACDAGALAGRKAMGGGTWTQTVGGVTNYPGTKALEFFNGNYNQALYGATNITKSFTESAGKVTGNASATVPMTLMRIFGKQSATLSVTCDAEMQLPDTDIMFVLDVTGSMACKPDGTSCGTAGSASKMSNLKFSVKCFYQVLARLDIPDADCAGDEPSGGTSSQVQIRFGFVPYSMDVNVGKLLPNSYFPNTWHYQTRRLVTAGTTTSNGPYWETYSGGSVSQSNCLKFMTNQSFTGFTPTATTSGTAPSPTVVITFPSDGAATDGGSTGEWGWTGASDTSGTTKSCRRRRTDTTTTYPVWSYGQFDVDISGLKAGGSNWNSSFNWPIGTNGANKTINWNGCIEERDTVQAASYDPIPSGAYDLNIDAIPSSLATQWKPALPDLTYLRNVTTTYNAWGQLVPNYANADRTNPTANTYTDYYNTINAGCPAEAKKLQAWPVASAFDDYVDGLQPVGNTYHDIGLIWGARLISPTGIFSAETNNKPDIKRHIVFMTDGIAQANPCDYSAYGIAWYDRRTTSTVGTASACGNENTTLDSEINKRFSAMCQAVKNKNITLWVVSFGSGVDQATKDRLDACATDGDDYFVDATTAGELEAAFTKIANKISQLRLTN